MIDANVHFYWDGRDSNRKIVSAGEYFFRIATHDGSFSESKKVIFMGDK
jgi:flagellar hook assembly protein FlgD